MFDSLLGPVVAPIVRSGLDSVDLGSLIIVGLVAVVAYAMVGTSFLFPRKY